VIAASYVVEFTAVCCLACCSLHVCYVTVVAVDIIPNLMKHSPNTILLIVSNPGVMSLFTTRQHRLTTLSVSDIIMCIVSVKRIDCTADWITHY